MGEEVTKEFIGDLLMEMVTFWNSQVENIAQEVREKIGPQLLQQIDETVTEGTNHDQIAQLHQAAHAQIAKILEYIQPCHCSRNVSAVQFLGDV